MSTTIGDLMENKQVEAAGDHAAIGGGVIAITMMFSHSWLPFLIVEGLLIPFVLWKEFWYDLHSEDGETLTSSTQDALGYLAGNVLAWSLLLLAHHLGTWTTTP
jgi:hypothetical protein